MGMAQTTFNPIAVQLTEIYDLNRFKIMLGPYFFLLMHPFFTFPAANIAAKKGSNISFSIGCSLGILGIWVRCLINTNFYFSFIGFFILGIARPFIINIMGLVVNNWFPKEERSIITGISTFIMSASMVIGIEYIYKYIFTLYTVNININ
jgi:FLVCR family feline leukemia virus subgroup C receptor-related protein